MPIIHRSRRPTRTPLLIAVVRTCLTSALCLPMLGGCTQSTGTSWPQTTPRIDPVPPSARCDAPAEPEESEDAG